MELNFSNQKYYEKAIAAADCPPVSTHTAAEAFMLLIRDAGFSKLENLVSYLQKAFPDLAPEQLYEMTQQNAGCESGGNCAAPETILQAAYTCLDNGCPLGTETIHQGTINTSDWMGHSVLEAKLCGQLAGLFGLDPDRACRLGMLHDYGRRETHTLQHTIRGFELLTDQGWDAEAVGCLTHSFLGGGRCASNEMAEPGFYVDASGNPCWEPDAKKDQMTQFLEKYHYTDYDLVLNIADLMATSKAIVSPLERIQDIATRRTIDPTNRGYFLAELADLLNRMSDRLEQSAPEATGLKFSSGMLLEAAEAGFRAASERFYALYRNRISESDLNLSC